ncbi:MAG: hypothetical protein KAW12_19340 [Candidatus Aminicenantes bacterium]|nr:hypothetical protein [Candidatus Aminicenantes bacterium]
MVINKVGMKMFEQRVHDSSKGDLFAYDEVYRLDNVRFNSPEPCRSPISYPGWIFGKKRRTVGLQGFWFEKTRRFFRR